MHVDAKSYRIDDFSLVFILFAARRKTIMEELRLPAAQYLTVIQPSVCCQPHVLCGVQLHGELLEPSKFAADYAKLTESAELHVIA